MKQIYTKTGDKGETSLRDGVRVAKDDPRIEANGELDHLNALLGVVRSMLPEGSTRELIFCLQRELMSIMSHVIPGNGSTLSAIIHTARTQARTVERRLWSLSRQYAVDESILIMMNRLSDYLFVLANEKK